MALVTLSSGDRIEFTLYDKTYKGVIREVVPTSDVDYVLIMDSNDPECSIESIRVECKSTQYLRT